MPNLKDLLAVSPTAAIKVADVESPDEVQLEQDFANLAFMFLKDRAAPLMPYLLGFEVVDREEDGSRAVGIFGFKIANKYYYVPAFFVNNQVKGMDLLYSKDTNSFTPLRETWINQILNKSTIRLGEAAGNPGKLREDFEQPNFEFLAEPPAAVKSGSAGTVMASVKDAFEVWNNLQGAVVEGMHKDAEFQQALAGAIATLKHATVDMDKPADGGPIVSFMRKHGGPRAVQAFLRTVQGSPKFASALLEFYPDVKNFFVSEFDPALAPKQAASKVTVMASPDGCDCCSGPSLGEDDRKRLVRDGFAIIDRRDDSEKSQLYDVDYVKKFSNPSESGLYKLLLPTGATAKAWVLQGVGGQTGKSVLCVEPKNKFFFTADPVKIFVDGDKLEGESPYDAGIGFGDMEIDRRYALVNPAGAVSAPFRVEAATAEAGERVRIRVWFDTSLDHGSHDNRSWDLPGNYATYGSNTRYLQLANHPGKVLRCTGEDLIVPSDWKALPLVTKWEYEDQSRPKDPNSPVAPARADARNAYDAFAPGDLLDVQENLFKSGVYKLAVGFEGGSEYTIFVEGRSQGPLSYKQAMCNLVGRHGMSVDDAENTLASASRVRRAEYLVKGAQLVGAYAPMPQPPGPMSEDISGLGLPMEQPFMEANEGMPLGAGEWQDSTQPGFAVGGQSEQESGMGEDINALAQQAAMTGQKHIFDHASIGGLARMYDSGAAIDMYVPDLTKALDRLGRILFIFYWKNEDFAERYGEEDLAEMEDMLRGVFKSYGDLVLKLKQKSVTDDMSDAEAQII